MEKICLDVFHDRETYPDSKFHKRKDLLKAILEEYWPLTQLLKCFGEKAKGRLTEHSNTGPDAVVHDEEIQYFVQITCADQSYKEALNREILSEGQLVFPEQNKVRDKKNNKIISEGRFLTTRKAKLKSQVLEVEAAINKKVRNFHNGTDYLLVYTNIHLSDMDIDYSWQEDLREKINNIQNMPYKKIYITHKQGVFITSSRPS